MDRSSLRAVVAVFVASAAFASSGAAYAQANDAKAQAEALFDEGKKLMTAGQTAAACPKFEESIRGAPGLGAMLWLGDCYESLGRTASAWAEFREAAAFASERRDPREKVARKRATTLEPKLAKLRVIVPSAHAADLVVTRDGDVLARGAWGTEVPVDPGEHKVVAKAPGRLPWEGVARVEARPGVTSITIGELAVAPAPPPPPAPTVAAVPVTPPPIEEQSTWSTQKTVGLVVGGVGIAGLAVGAVFGLIAKSQYDDANTSDCDSRGVCNAKGLQTRVDALNAATVSTIGFVAGGALVAGGVVLFVTAPSRQRMGLTVGPSVARAGAGLTVGGAW